jgi:membrane protein
MPNSLSEHHKQFKIKDLGKLFKITVNEWWRKDPFRESIPGLLMLIIAIAGYFFGKDSVIQNILDQISDTMGKDIAMQIRDILIKEGDAKTTLWGSIIGITTILVGSTGVFVELQKTFNVIWQVKVVEKKGILPILRARLFSFGLILAIAFLLTISLVISTALAAMNNWIRIGSSEATAVFFNILNFIISLGVISTLFGLMFKILPDAKIKWKHVWLGSIVTGLLFTIGKTGLAFYFSKANPASVYGAAGTIILMLLWVSYSSMILFFGAEFTAAYATIYSGEVPPSDIAKKVKE